MQNLIHLRLDCRLRKEIRNVLAEQMFSNESEFIRDSIRKNIESYKKIKLLESLRHSLPRRGAKGHSSDVFREFGLE